MLDVREIAPETLRPIRRVEYEQMGSLGLFEDERVELLDGAIVGMSPKGAPHEATIDRLVAILVTTLQGRARVRVQGTFAASQFSEPEPDLLVMPDRDYDDAHPDQAFLVIEVADSSLRKDRGPKARIYAAAGVPEYWIVNLLESVVEVHLAPTDAGYARIDRATRGDTITLVSFPDVVVAVDAFLR